MKSQLSVKLMLMTLVVTLLSGGSVPAPRPVTDLRAEAGRELVQIKHDGHILGFQPTRVYFAAMDHLLGMEFLGTQGVTPRQTLDQVTYADLWDGVSVTYQTGVQGIAKTTYTVAPGADPGDIRLRYNLPVLRVADGSLLIGKRQEAQGETTQTGYMTESAPVAWQDIAGQRVIVQVEFKVAGENEVSFEVGNYNRRHPLVIDPTYAWHTFYGVKPVFAGTAIAADSNGNVYMVGNVTSEFYYSNFPSFAPRIDYHGGSDIVVIKYDSLGQAQWYTFLGGAYQDYGTGVAVSSNAVYVVGYSSASWNGEYYGTPLAPLHAYTSGYTDAVIISLSSSSGSMNWHTFYGSDNIDSAQGVTLLSDNSLVVVGSSYDTWQGPANQDPLHDFTGQYDVSDIMLLKLSANGAYLWHTFYGSTFHDYGRAVASSTTDTIYVSGNSNASGKNGTTEPLHTHSGGGDITVLSLTSAGACTWHTFYGSSGNDVATALLVDSVRNLIYVAGYSPATWDGAGSSDPLHAFSGGSDIFALTLWTDGIYNWHTFYGSGRTDEANGLALIPTSMGSVVLVGRSQLGWNGPADQLPEHAFNFGGDSWDLFALRLYYDGEYEWHTFYGSEAPENAAAVVYQSAAGLVLTGLSEDAWPDYSTVKHYSGQNILRLTLNSTNGDYLNHKFYGNSEGDQAYEMAVTSLGGVVLVGNSIGSWLGGGNVAPKHAHSGGADGDIAVLKLDNDGAYLWHTFYGASGYSDAASDVAMDASDNIFISFNSRVNWLGDGSAAPLNPHSGGATDAGVLKLNYAGTYQWHTFLGGSGSEYTTGIAVSNTLVYVTGYSGAGFLGPGSNPPVNGHQGSFDILVFSIYQSDGAYLWHTFHGDSLVDDIGRDIALDVSLRPYIIGHGGDWSGPDSELPLHEAIAVDDNLVVLKLYANGVYNWHTFYGDRCGADAIAIQGDAVVGLGECYTGWNGDGGAAPRQPYNASLDVAVIRLDRNGAYQWHTFLGGSLFDAAEDVTIAPDGMVYVAGYGNAWDGPGGQSPAHAHSGGYDAMIISLMPSGHYLWHTFYGSTANDYAVGVGVDKFNYLYAGGHSVLSWRGDGDTAALHAHSGSGDFFALRLNNLLQRIYAPLVRR